MRLYHSSAIPTPVDLKPLPLAGPEEHVYSIELTLFGEIDADDVKQASTDRTVTLVIAKKEVGPYWPRLLKEKGRVPQYLKTDWSKWVDEDEVEEEKLGGAEDFGGFDMSQLQNFTNTLGGDTLEEDSENDEDIPPLEKAS